MELTFLQRAEVAERTTAIDESRIISEAALAVFGRKDERYKRVLQLLEAGASLDAALTLVPEGDSFTVGQNVHHGHWVASVNYLDDDGAPQSRGCSNACRTGPLALCAAALRARAETQP